MEAELFSYIHNIKSFDQDFKYFNPKNLTTEYAICAHWIQQNAAHCSPKLKFSFF